MSRFIGDVRTGTPFHDRAWQRADMLGWDRRWHALSQPARQQFLAAFKSANAGSKARVPLLKVPEAIREELLAAGFVEVQKTRTGGELHAVEAARGFLTRLRLLQRCRLLDSSDLLAVYASMAYDHYRLNLELGKIVEKALKVGLYELPSSPLGLFVDGPRWPGWVADYLNSPLARTILVALREAGGRWSLAKLGELLPGRDENEVRREVDALVNHLALAEMIDPATQEILVGFLPGALHSPSPRSRDLVAKVPEQVMPDDGLIIPDLRALLLELSAAPAQIKQSAELFARDQERLQAVLAPIPGWLTRPPSTTDRINTTLNRALNMGLLSRIHRTGKTTISLSPVGDAWMALPPGRQFAAVFAHLREPTGEWAMGDRIFLGVPFAVMARKPGKRHLTAHDVAHEADAVGLRRALHTAFQSLPLGTYFTMASVLAHFSDPSRNPLLLGRAMNEVAMVGDDFRLVLSLEEVVEATTQRFLLDFISARLWAYGCVQLGTAGDDNVIAATPRLAMYFDPAAPIPESPQESVRVIVQPDFSVVIIGMGTAAAADLAGFADRPRTSNTPGVLTLKLSREGVLRGMQTGLSGEEMLARLKKHASVGVPANVEEQVRTWASQSRVVQAGAMLVLRCPDEESASRVMAALGKKAERLGPTSVGFDGKLTGSIREKLTRQSVLLREEEGE